MSNTTLPPELERIIFEMAASHDPSMKICLQLMLVAKYVHDWIKPILYSVFRQISYSNSTIYPNFSKYPSLKLEDVGPLAKHLIVGGDLQGSDVNRFLSSCPNIHNLALWVGNEALCDVFPQLQRLPLQRLSVDFDMLLSEVDDFAGPPFSTITHLDVILFEGRSWLKSCSVFAKMPRLTHLAMNVPVEIDVIQKLLRHCSTLRVLIVLHESGPIWYGEDQFTSEVIKIEDVRLVLIEDYDAVGVIQDWTDGAYGDLDTWLFSDYISLARRRKYLLDNSQRWISKDFPWQKNAER